MEGDTETDQSSNVEKDQDAIIASLTDEQWISTNGSQTLGAGE